MRRFEQVTIVGLGLIGGSLGMALKRHRAAGCVVGVSRRRATLAQAKRRGAIDCGTTDLAAGVREADLVVLAAPVGSIVALGRRAARAMRPGSVLTDVGSTKVEIVRALERGLPRGIAFIGGHPIAGSERQGIRAADAHLFDGSLSILTPTRRTPRAATAVAHALWTPVVDRVITMSPEAHDRALAATSHLPHLLAFCLADAVPARALPRTPRSLAEMTRIAGSDPDLWDDILLTNRGALLASIAAFDRSWSALKAALTRRDRTRLMALLTRAQGRHRVLARDGR